MKGCNTDFETIVHKKWPDLERRSMWTRMKRTPPRVCAWPCIYTGNRRPSPGSLALCRNSHLKPRSGRHPQLDSNLSPAYTSPRCPSARPVHGQRSECGTRPGPDPLELGFQFTRWPWPGTLEAASYTWARPPGRKPVRGPGLRLERGGAGEREQVHTSPPPAAASILMLYPTLSWIHVFRFD